MAIGMSRRAALKGSIALAGAVGAVAARPLLGAGAVRAAEPSGPLRLSATEALSALREKRFSARAYAEAVLARCAALSDLNAFINQDGDALLAAAASADERRASGNDAAPLLGLPLAVKDNINTVDLPTTGGTPGLRDWTPSANAPVMQTLLDAGALLAGKTNMHELAFGITSNNVGFGAVRNPYDQALIPGGSSGGTAAAVAARMVPAGLGTDTGGSCRIPAALCGCLGFRPSHGRYSQAGVIPISHTRDTIAPLARSVADIALLDRVCSGEALAALEKPIEEIRIGVPATYFYENLDYQLEIVVAKALERFRAEGVQLIDVDVENVQTLNESVAFPIALFEVLRELGAYLYSHGNPMSVPELVEQAAGEDVKGLLTSLMGDNAVPASLYREVIAKGRPALQRSYASYFEDNQLDAMVVPTTPLPARPIGEEETVDLNGEQVSTFMTYIRNTDPPSNAGLPCLTVPAGLTEAGLPVGVEFVGPAGGDAAVLHIGGLFEAVTGALPAPEL
ncbi:MAG: indoleacetamide hydrolase [Alphaproteobacteria bacterium]|nr:indoleacetamide hydrolase [Alphaproteobacteria bacterium]